MTNPGFYYLPTYQYSSNGSGGSSSARLPHLQYPSPTDSNSSRGHRYHDVEMENTNDRQINNLPLNLHIPGFMPTRIETESMENPPQFSTTQSSRYPSLHFLLARDSMRANRFTLNLRVDPLESVPRDVFESFGALWATRDRPVHMRIVSPDFPWVIDINAGEALEEADRGVTCGDVWSKLYTDLLEPINDNDWAYLNDMATRDRDPVARRRLEHLVSIARQQIERGESVTLIRLDWLLRKAFFIGLERDEGHRLSAQRLLPGRERCVETWVAHFSERG